MEAAAYCGGSCPVRPISIYTGQDGYRHDVADLNKRIDGLKDPQPTAEEWLAKFGSGPAPRRGKQ